jgi:hypothetical protein
MVFHAAQCTLRYCSESESYVAVDMFGDYFFIFLFQTFSDKNLNNNIERPKKNSTSKCTIFAVDKIANRVSKRPRGKDSCRVCRILRAGKSKCDDMHRSGCGP